MKKNLLMMAALFCCLFAVTACGSDEPKTKTTVKGTYTLEFNQDVLDAANVIIYYLDANGAKRFVAVTTTNWTKTVTNEKFPAQYAFQIAISPKDASSLTKETYDLQINAVISGELSTGEKFYNSKTILGVQNLAKDKVVSTLEKHDGDAMGYNISKDGTASAMSKINLK